MAIRQAQGRRQLHRYALEAPHLANFSRYRQGRTDQQQVVDHPQRTDDHRAVLVARPVVEAPHREGQAYHVERGQHQVRPGDAPVEPVALVHAALDGDVEVAAFGREQRHQGRTHDVPGQHRLVDLAPEGLPVRPLNPRVDQAGM
ncbi:hypothetical protein D3C72_2022710 [compost metagenome]